MRERRKVCQQRSMYCRAATAAATAFAIAALDILAIGIAAAPPFTIAEQRLKQVQRIIILDNEDVVSWCTGQGARCSVQCVVCRYSDNSVKSGVGWGGNRAVHTRSSRRTQALGGRAHAHATCLRCLCGVCIFKVMVKTHCTG